ncbi:temptin-like isoform X2 [Haliotis asinina]|uniref:temptin-like isoform X2 n=1 Tax=Haliotis asinina TaxID=109174 RepID=UPI0035325918
MTPSRWSMFMMFLACVLCLCAAGVQAIPSFLDRIPNGQHVKHPCNPEVPWRTDFRAEGYTWTVALCRRDSDGDGRSNGDELGDPNCTWPFGQTTVSRNISHPGIVCNGPHLRHHRK